MTYPAASLLRDGASRCGLFCAAGFLCEQIRSEALVDVSQAVRMLKRQRRQLVKDVVSACPPPRTQCFSHTAPGLSSREQQHLQGEGNSSS